MLEIRKGTAAKNYENTFFREFAENLKNLFDKYSLDGLLIANSECESENRLQIDALLVTQKVVCIIDFKNFGGKIILPKNDKYEFEVGIWINDKGEIVKGGSFINPFAQLRYQKNRFVKVVKNQILEKFPETDCFKPEHTIRIVCFQKTVELIGTIPHSEEQNFFIIDKRNYLEKIKDIIDVFDKEVSITNKSFKFFKEEFRADPFDISENYEKSFEVTTYRSALNYENLYPDQKAALSEIKSFLENQEQQVFVLQGTINSGKSYLISFIRELADNSQIQETEIFAASSRVAKNLLSSNVSEKINSIYSFIYGGLKSDVKENENREINQTYNETEDIIDEITLEVVPLKKSDNSENALFIVDESQLISDSYHQSIDTVFGSGHLLKDFIKFTSFDSSRRKIIFIGDPYQLQLGKTDGSPLNPKYLEENYNLKVSSFKLLDKPDFSEINQQCLNCVQSIKDKLFNSMSFNSGNQITIIKNEDKLPRITNLIANNIDGHILSYSNEEAQKINLWIKKSVIKSGEDIAAKDLVLFNNNISIEDENDPFAESKKIYNGQFATVLEVSQNIISESIIIKKEQTVINFRELTLKLTETGHIVKVLSLENYRLNHKAELSKNEIIAFSRILSDQVTQYINENPFEKSYIYKELISSTAYKLIINEIDTLKHKLERGEKVKGKLEEKERYERNLLRTIKREYRNKIENNLRKNPTTKYHKYINAAKLRFGWAMTVHKAMSYKWDEVFFNIETGGGKTNENYFRWLYTGICRAKHKLNLINYKPISPFENVVIKDQNSNTRPREIFFRSENPEKELRLNELREFVVSKLTDFAVINVEHYNWQERYFIRNENGQEAIISFSYNGQGNFRSPSIIGGNADLSAKVVEILKQKTELKDYEFVKDLWRKREYEKLKNYLSFFEIKFELILQTSWKDKIRFFSEKSELDIELDYGVNGMVSYITAKYYSDETIWNNFKNAIEQL